MIDEIHRRPHQSFGRRAHPHHGVADELHQPATVGMHHVGDGGVEFGEQVLQLRGGERLGQRGEAGQIRKADTARHACRRVANDAFKVGSCAGQVVTVDGVDQRTDPGTNSAAAR